MSTLVVYESFFGNTEKVAQAIASAIEASGDTVRAVKLGEASAADLNGVDRLVVGSATRAFRPSPETMKFLGTLRPGSLDGISVAAFDTRAKSADVPRFLQFMMKLFGYAAEKIEKKLVAAGGTRMAQSEGFFVGESEGPLLDGELERAGAWLTGTT